MDRRDFLELSGLTAAGVLIPFTLTVDGFPKLPKAEGGLLKVIDLSEGIKYFLSPEMRRVVENASPATQLVHEYDVQINKNLPISADNYDRKYSFIQNFGVRALNLREACKKLAEMITQTHETHTIKAILALGQAITLTDKSSYACVTYIGFVDQIDENEYLFSEGEIPKAIYDNPVNLNELKKKERKQILAKVASGNINITTPKSQ